MRYPALLHLILVFFVLLLSSCALPPPNGDARQCTSNADCILTKEPECCGCSASVNKEYQTWYEHQRPSVAECEKAVCEACPEVQGTVSCDKNRCTVH